MTTTRVPAYERLAALLSALVFAGDTEAVLRQLQAMDARSDSGAAKAVAKDLTRMLAEWSPPASEVRQAA